MQKKTGIRKPERLIEIFIQPFTRVKHLQDAKLYSENTARNYLNRLAELGVLEKKNYEGSHYYLNLELYSICQNKTSCTGKLAIVLTEIRGLFEKLVVSIEKN